MYSSIPTVCAIDRYLLYTSENFSISIILFYNFWMSAFYSLFLIKILVFLLMKMISLPLNIFMTAVFLCAKSYFSSLPRSIYIDCFPSWLWITFYCGFACTAICFLSEFRTCWVIPFRGSAFCYLALKSINVCSSR